jgi:hypothetical protein
MPKFTVEKIVATSYKQEVEAKNMGVALNKAKRKNGAWQLDNQNEEYNVTPDNVGSIGFGR